MANLLEFVVKLSDMMSPAMNRVSQNVIQSFSKMSEAQSQFNSTNKKSIYTIDSLNASLEKLKNDRNKLNLTSPEEIFRLRMMNSEIKSLEKNVQKFSTLNGNKLKTWAKDAFQQLPGAGLISNPLVMGGTVAAYATKQAMDVQANKVKFSTLMGGDAMGNYMYNNLKSYADVTPYSKDDLLKSGETMLNYGVAKSKIMPTLKMIGDISGGSAERMNSLSLAFGQIYAKGHLAGQEVLQMVNAGFNPLQAISEKTGKSMNELDKMMSKGKISVDMVTSAMQSATGEGGRFHGMMERLGGTLQGQISTFLDRVNNIAASLGTVTLPIVNTGLQGLNTVLNFLTNNATAIITVLGSLATAFVISNAAMIAQKISAEWLLFTNNKLILSFLQMGKAMLLNPWTYVVLGIVAAISAIIYAWNHFEKFRQVVLGVWEVMKNLGSIIKDYVVARITELLNGIMGIGKALAQLFSGNFKDAWETTKKSAGQIIGIGSAVQVANNVSTIYSVGSKKGTESFKKDEEAKYQQSLVKKGDPLFDTITKAYDIAHNTTLQKETFGSDKNALSSFLELAKQITYNKGIFKTNQKGNAMDFIIALDDAMKSKKMNGAGDPDKAKSIASGGPRVINIYGVKFMDKLEMHVQTLSEGIENMEERFQELMLRTLNSGAAVQ